MVLRGVFRQRNLIKNTEFFVRRSTEKGNINNVKNYVPINNVKNYVPINPLTAEWALRTLYWFYSAV